MPISRRALLRSGTVATAAVALAPLLPAHDHTTVYAATPAASSVALPAAEVIALHRMAYGPRPADIGRVKALGLPAYIDEQLNPTAIDDSDCATRLANARIKISYAADSMGRYPAVSEARPLLLLDKTTTELWERTKGTVAWSERMRPFEEVRAAAWIRAVYSKRQLLEVLVEFWHNHFNVNATSDSAIAATFPAYDRIMRANCLGNFRTFVEEVGRSTAMMYALDNVSNQAGGGEGGNENYARELIELHTLGSDNYLKFYDDRRTIGTITYNDETFTRGYIDDDVYEAARCLTGWTIGNGNWQLPASTPNNGEFYYNAGWHDSNPKTVLSIDGYPNIPRSQPDLKDARDVYTILARHVGTARHICTKLCRRLIADYPSGEVVDAAVATWMANRDAPDQLKQVVGTILTSDAFRTIWGQKVKRPFEALVAYMRATNAQLPIDYYDAAKPNDGGLWGGLNGQLSATGHRIFEWPTPTGYPDLASYWDSTNGLLRRWNLPYLVTQSWGGGVAIDITGQTNLGMSCTDIIDFWIGQLCGFTIDPGARDALIAFLSQGGDVNKPPKALSNAPDWNSPDAVVDRLLSVVQLLAATPDFHTR